MPRHWRLTTTRPATLPSEALKPDAGGRSAFRISHPKLQPVRACWSFFSLGQGFSVFIVVASRHTVRPCIAAIVDNLREDFMRWGEFDKSARVANHSRDGVIELMPISVDLLYSFNYVNGYPRNTRLGLSTVMAFRVLSHVDTRAGRSEEPVRRTPIIHADPVN
jgi:Ornithine cyclodeaminase/mu-crystallin family